MIAFENNSVISGVWLLQLPSQYGHAIIPNAGEARRLLIFKQGLMHNHKICMSRVPKTV